MSGKNINSISFMPILTEKEIEQELKEAIREERYEDAVLLRDGNIIEYQLKYQDHFNLTTIKIIPDSKYPPEK